MSKKLKGSILTMDVTFFIIMVALIAAYCFSNISPTIDESKIQVATTDVTTIGGAVSHYHFDMEKYPQELSDLTKQDATTKKGPWIAALPNGNRDPWGNTYQYVYDADEHDSDGNTGFIVYCTTSTTGDGISINMSQAENLPQNSIAYHGL